VKVGVRDGAVYVETHRDIYGYTPAVYREATVLLERAGLRDRVDERLLVEALDDTSGMPIRVTPESPEGDVVPASAALGGSEPTETHGDRVPYPDQHQAGDD
jgi:hypothetical protein